MMVKICGITNREDALVSVESGAAALGFNFYPDSPRYVAPERAKAIVEVVPVTIWKVGVFVSEPPENALRIASEAGMDILQIHGNAADYDAVKKVGTLRAGCVESANTDRAGVSPFFHSFYRPGLRLWKALRAGPDFSPAEIEDPNAEAFLLDTPSDRLHGGTGQTFDWKAARGLPGKIIIAGGLDEKNVRQAIEEAEPWGVDACSRLEASPGRKDHLKLTRFLKAALS